MASLALDTHALVWCVEGSPQLSGPALAALQIAVALGEPIYVPSICLVEIAYLMEKGKLPAPLFDRINLILQQGQTVLTAISFTLEMADVLRSIPRLVLPDMPDRMIAATARGLGVTLVSRDQRIQNSGVPTIW